MKKLLLLVFALMLGLSFACAQEETPAFAPTDSTVLVACFSATGNTWPLAAYAAEYLNADLFRIEPEVPYTDADLNYSDSGCRANREMNDETCRPALAATVENMEQYDTVFVGFPIWWAVEPRVVDTFLEGYDFSGKTAIPFATSGGSGISRAEKSLEDHCPKADWKRGKLVNSGAAAWARSVLGL